MDHKLIADLYSTCTAPEKWPPLLSKLPAVVGAKNAGLIIMDMTQPEGSPPHQFATVAPDIDPEVLAVYNRDYAHYEAPIVERALSVPPGELVTDPGFDDLDTIVKRPDVAYAMEHFGLFHRFGMRLNDEKAWGDVIAFQYAIGRDNVTEQEFSNLRPYFPHLAQSIVLGRMFDEIRDRYRAVLSMLDRVNIGMLLMNSNSEIIIKNECASQTLENNPHLSVANGNRLKASGNQTSELQKAVIAVANTVGEGGQTASNYVRLGDDSNNDSLVIELSPLIDSEAEIDGKFRGVLALIIDPNVSLQVNLDLMQRIYALSQAETEVADLVSQGHNYNSVAERRNVSLDTVKTQIKSLMKKMQTNSRAGIVKKFLSLGLPFK